MARERNKTEEINVEEREVSTKIVFATGANFQKNELG